MARLDYKVSVTPIEQTAAGVDGGPVQTETMSYSFQKTLGGGNSSLPWNSGDSTEWNAGVNTYVTSATSDIVASTSSCNGVFIKHSGVDFADGTTVNDVAVNVVVDAASEAAAYTIAVLKGGEAMFLPAPANTLTFKVTTAGTAARIEYAVFV